MTTHTPLRCSFSQMAASGQAGARVVLLDSGNYPSYSSFLNETWTFSGTDWTNQSTTLVDANGPLPGRNDGMMAFDGNNTVLFGGRGGSSTDGVFQDTWTWSGTAWTKKSPTTVPFGRYKAEMAFLQGTGAVMFGGRTINDMLLETWVWNGTTQQWSQVSVANGAGPAARVDACFAGSASAPLALLFGGAGTNSLFNDTWTFNGTTWTKQSPTTSPPARSQACMAYATTGTSFVLFGGQNGVQTLNDTWVSANGTSWTQVTGSGPAGRVGAEMAYDATSGKVIMFGGNSAGTNYPSNETWAFDAVGLTWTQL